MTHRMMVIIIMIIIIIIAIKGIPREVTHPCSKPLCPYFISASVVGQLKGGPKRLVLALGNSTLLSSQGFKEIIDVLDKAYGKERTESAFESFMRFTRFKRQTMSVKEFVLEHEVRLRDLERADVQLSGKVLMHFVAAFVRHQVRHQPYGPWSHNIDECNADEADPDLDDDLDEEEEELVIVDDDGLQ